ncbi:hypothetical protein [Mycolicibacterium sp. HS_4_1]
MDDTTDGSHAPPATAWCGKCRTHRPVTDFHRSSRNKSGRQSHCKQCMCAARVKSYQANPQQAAEYNRQYRESNAGRKSEVDRAYRAENPITERLRRGKNRAIKAGLPADDITTEELLADWQRRGIDPTLCVYTGEPLEDGWHIDHTVPLSHPSTPGHVVTNLVPCNPLPNRTKGRRHWIDYLADRAQAAHRKAIA